MFKAALTPVLSQLTNLNKNVSSVLLDGHDKPDEDGETTSVDGPTKSVDVDADVQGIYTPHPLGEDDSNEAMPGDDLLKELAQDLTVSKMASLPPHGGLAPIFNNLLLGKMGMRSSRPNLKNNLVLRMSRVCKHRK